MGEKMMVCVKFEEYIVCELICFVVILIYKFFSLRIVVVILDVKKYNIVIVDILLNESVKDFFV